MSRGSGFPGYVDDLGLCGYSRLAASPVLAVPFSFVVSRRAYNLLAGVWAQTPQVCGDNRYFPSLCRLIPEFVAGELHEEKEDRLHWS